MSDMTSTVGPANNYVSDAELLAWLEAKSTEQYGVLRDQMNGSTGRQELIQELTDLKTKLERCSSNDDADAIAEDMKALLDEYEGSEYEAELTALFGPAIQVTELDGTTSFEIFGDQIADPVWLASSGLSEQIASETNKLDKLDSLALIEIQQTMSDAKQTEQLASNVLSSRDQTANSIVGNIRG